MEIVNQPLRPALSGTEAKFMETLRAISSDIDLSPSDLVPKGKLQPTLMGGVAREKILNNFIEKQSAENWEKVSMLLVLEAYQDDMLSLNEDNLIRDFSVSSRDMEKLEQFLGELQNGKPRELSGAEQNLVKALKAFGLICDLVLGKKLLESEFSDLEFPENMDQSLRGPTCLSIAEGLVQKISTLAPKTQHGSPTDIVPRPGDATNPFTGPALARRKEIVNNFIQDPSALNWDYIARLLSMEVIGDSMKLLDDRKAFGFNLGDFNMSEADFTELNKSYKAYCFLTGGEKNQYFPIDSKEREVIGVAERLMKVYQILASPRLEETVEDR